MRLQPVTDEERTRLAQIWTDDARAEHAAVAAFSKLALQLLALRAPPDLVARVSFAAVQQVDHARLCFAIASAYGGTPLGPAPLPEAVHWDDTDLDRIAHESLLDGCIGEGVAAEMARLGAQSARDPEVARVLRILASDEAAHAELAWSIVEWCVARGGETLCNRLRRALDDANMPRCHELPEHGHVGARALEHAFGRLRANMRERLDRACTMVA